MRSVYLFVPGLTIGVGMLVYGVLLDGRMDRTDWRALGIAVSLWMLTWLFSHRTRRGTPEIFELGRQKGYDQGYADGRRIARPTVVRMDTRGCPGCQRPDQTLSTRHS